LRTVCLDWLWISTLLTSDSCNSNYRCEPPVLSPVDEYSYTFGNLTHRQTVAQKKMYFIISITLKKSLSSYNWKSKIW
jgi:hypothetical protein